MFLPSLFFTLEYETSPLCDMELGFPERGTCTSECGDFKHPGFLGSGWRGAPASCRAVAIPGSSSSPAEEGTDLGQNNGPQLMRPPPFRPGTDSDNHPFCNKQETSLPASKIEQTKTPKYEALTVGRLGFLTLLPDSLQSTCFCFCFKFHARKYLAISL